VWRGNAKRFKTTEAPVGIEPTNRGFADLCLTTWLRRRAMQGLNLLRQGLLENPRTATSNTADDPQSSVIRMITISALFHPARRWRRRHARRLGSDSLGRSRGRNRGRDFGSRRIARRILENAIESAD